MSSSTTASSSTSRRKSNNARLSPPELIRLAAPDGYLALSDSEPVALNQIVSVAFAQEHAPAGPGWGPGLQDEDAAAAAESSYREGQKLSAEGQSRLG